MLDQKTRDIVDQLRQARDALNGAVSTASAGDLFSAGAYTRNAHVILETLLEGEKE